MYVLDARHGYPDTWRQGPQSIAHLAIELAHGRGIRDDAFLLSATISSAHRLTNCINRASHAFVG